jgi:hypothetical protein
MADESALQSKPTLIRNLVQGVLCACWRTSHEHSFHHFSCIHVRSVIYNQNINLDPRIAENGYKHGGH